MTPSDARHDRARSGRARPPRAAPRGGAIPKAPTGIAGFDHVSRGGLPRGGTTLVLGEAGSGKTVFALQTLVNGARAGEPGIFVAFEESAGQIVANAGTFGWDLPALMQRDLFFLDARLSPDVVQAGPFDLTALIASIEAKARAMKARRIALDGIDVLLAHLDDPALERREVVRLHEFLRRSGLTAILTSKAGGPSAGPIPYDFMQFMVDCVLSLSRRLDDQVAFRTLRVVKYRGSGHAENACPLVIAHDGLVVSPGGAASPPRPASQERVTSGVSGLDAMLGGGYLVGSSTLISGSPGTGKSTLASAFARATCRRGERVLYVTFDESAAEIVRNMASVGIDLAAFVKKGTLHIVASDANAQSAEEHYSTFVRLLADLAPRAVVFDPMSALTKAGGGSVASTVAQRILRAAKDAAATIVLTSLEVGDPLNEGTAIAVSTLADTWIHVSNVARGGERNRAITICKARGTRHSNQVRELLIGDDGVSLADVYCAEGEVLMGTARWEREAEERAAEERRAADLSLRRAGLLHAEAELQGRLRSLELELAARRTELDLLVQQEAAHERRSSEGAAERRARRTLASTRGEPPRRGRRA